MTWYYMPSTSVADTAALNSPSPMPESTPEPWLTLSGKATQRPLSWRGWKNRAWIRLLSGLTCSPSTLQRGADEWISSLPVSLASHSAPPANGWALTTTATSGRGSQASSATFDPDSSCWRTSGELFEQCYPMSSLTLPDSGSMRNGECSPRPPLVHPIAANAGGAWPTSTARDDQKSPEAHMAMKGRMNRNTPTSLTVVAKMWPTPLAHNSEQRAVNPPDRTRTLVDAAKMWPTPRASEGSSGSSAASRADFRPTLKQSVAMWPTPRASMNENRTTGNAPSHGNGHGYTLAGMALTSGPHDPTTETAGSSGKVLNPEFVGALMGLPPGWLTPSTSAATDSSPNVPQKRYGNSPTGQE